MTASAQVRQDLHLPAGQVLGRLGDPDVARHRAVAVPGLQGEVVDLTVAPTHAAAGGDGPVVDLTIRAGLPTDWVPAQVRDRLHGSPAVRRRECWWWRADGALEARVDVELEAVPATTLLVRGHLVPDPLDPGAAVLAYDLSLTVGVPVLGRGIERAVMDQLRGAYERECAVIAAACR